MYFALRDFRFALRIFAKAPAFSGVALLALALGMGATTAIFSVVDAVLWKPLPFRDPDRLVVIWEKNPALDRFRLPVAPVNFRAWKEQNQSLSGIAAILAIRLTLTGGPGGPLEPEELKIERVSASLFPLLGVQPVLGRSFREDEDQPGRNAFALVSHELWTRRLGSDPTIVGKPIQLGTRPVTVVGVLPRGFSILDPDVDLWVPLGYDYNNTRIASGRNLVVIARLRDGVAIERAHAEMETIGSRLEQADPELNQGWRPSIFPLMEELTGKVQRPLFVLSAAVGFLLFMACANVANLALARGASRHNEIAVRTALGAGRGRIVAQLLTESLLLSFAGGAIGLLLAQGGVALLAWLGTESIPRLAAAAVDLRVFLFAAVLSAAAGILFGLFPAFHVSQMNLNATLQEVPRGGSPGRRGRMTRNGLIVVEVALAVVVLIASGLLIRSFLRLIAADPGFGYENLLTFRVPLAGGPNAADERRPVFFSEIAAHMAALPGVRAVSVVDSLPLRGLAGGSVFTVEGRPPLPLDQRPVGLIRFVDRTYFQTMGIPLLQGRGFAATDTAQAAPVIIVNRTVVRRFWPEEGGVSPIGGRISVVAANGSVAGIVGVVGDVKSESIEKGDWPTIYYPYTQVTPTGMTFVLKTAGNPRALIGPSMREIRRIQPDQGIADILTMDEVVSGAVGGSRFHTVVLSMFAGIAFLLTAVGIYGVVSYDVSQRIREIGIRMALGAQRHDVMKLVMGQGAKLTGYGIVLGLAAAFLLTRWMGAMLYEVKASDALTFAGMSLLLGVVALVASYWPSRRAMALDPVTALRHE